MKDMLPNIYSAGLNIDYYPTNFIINKNLRSKYDISYRSILIYLKISCQNCSISTVSSSGSTR